MDKTKTPPAQKTYPPEVRALLERANQGDATALPEVKKAFDEYPELAAQCGDLVKLAEQALLILAAGRSLAAREAVARQVAQLRQRLTAAATSELEKLLVDRITISWIEVYHGDLQLAGHLLEQPGTAPAAEAAQKRLDRAHHRFLTAVKTLASVQKLTRPSPSPFELAQRSVPETAVPLGSRAGVCPNRGGVAVANY